MTGLPHVRPTCAKLIQFERRVKTRLYSAQCAAAKSVRRRRHRRRMLPPRAHRLEDVEDDARVAHHGVQPPAVEYMSGRNPDGLYYY